ncbi:MAG: DinB family protein [Acidobacteriota bacterium]
MDPRYWELENFIALRRQTLALVDGLDPVRARTRPEPGRWSVVEVLDHLVRVDTFFRRDLQRLLARARRGKPFLCSGWDRMNLKRPRGRRRRPIERGLRVALEAPAAVANAFVPPALRRTLGLDRRWLKWVPKPFSPARDRPLQGLRAELSAMIETTEALARTEGVDLRRLLYYSHLSGLGDVPTVYLSAASHERRHQIQLAELLDDPRISEGQGRKPSTDARW